eukprot:CAMPEP_0182540030 /NCGR_PEP_ID=MMETSP1323-20130603/26399_1 /TAXON_ID=236787 /ORGANISM="Florenciella parvula, Strain RCC1693" /LENGTH=47 /DNA_ID= /DNA_START= /DNA_END= /DNA_ORIENTATION=
MIYDVHSDLYMSWVTITGESNNGGGGGSGPSAPKIKAKGSDGKYQGE